MKKLYMPLCLLFASSACAVTSVLLQNMLTQEVIRQTWDTLSTEQQTSLDAYCYALEDLAQAANGELLNITTQNAQGSALFKGIMGVEQAALVQFMPMIMPAQMEAPSVAMLSDAAEENEETRFVS